MPRRSSVPWFQVPRSKTKVLPLPSSWAWTSMPNRLPKGLPKLGVARKTALRIAGVEGRLEEAFRGLFTGQIAADHEAAHAVSDDVDRGGGGAVGVYWSAARKSRRWLPSSSMGGLLG